MSVRRATRVCWTYPEIFSVLSGQDFGVNTPLLWNIVLHVCVYGDKVLIKNVITKIQIFYEFNKALLNRLQNQI
jgi:hypothetical protein